MSKLLRVEEVADRLGLKPATIRKMILRREIPVVRPTRRAVRVREEVVAAFCTVGYQPRPGVSTRPASS
jgi:excisionase family DNA binding protein